MVGPDQLLGERDTVQKAGGHPVGDVVKVALMLQRDLLTLHGGNNQRVVLFELYSCCSRPH